MRAVAFALFGAALVSGCPSPSAPAGPPIDPAKLAVLSDRYFVRSSLFGDEAVLEISARNDSSQPVSRVRFRGTLQSPSLPEPTLVREFEHRLREPLAPATRATWIIVPGRSSDWATVDAPRDAQLSVEVLEVE